MFYHTLKSAIEHSETLAHYFNRSISILDLHRETGEYGYTLLIGNHSKAVYVTL